MCGDHKTEQGQVYSEDSLWYTEGKLCLKCFFSKAVVRLLDVLVGGSICMSLVQPPALVGWLPMLDLALGKLLTILAIRTSI